MWGLGARGLGLLDSRFRGIVCHDYMNAQSWE